MENVTRSGLHDFHLASRKAEEAALRRYRAVYWLECLIGPLSVPDQPSEREFISCLRNGLILCNAINKIKPGSVPKVVETPLPSQSVVWDSKPLPAYQYFENVRNFLVAVKELQLPAFEASDLETESFEAGSAGRVVDCILALKSYHEWKQMNAGDGFYKNVKSPLVLHSANKNLSRPLNALSTDACRHLDMSAEDGDKGSLEDSIVKAITDYMVETKENISNNLLASFHTGKLDPVKTLSKILASGLEGQLQSSSAEIDDILREWTSSAIQSAYIAKRDLPTNRSTKRCRACLTKGSCAHWNLLRKQEEDLADINALLAQTKKEFEDLQSQMLNDMKQLGNQVHNMSTAALGYQQIMQENRNLYNMVQDLKGNIRVYCRIRPIFNAKTKNVIDFIGEDGSLVVVDPSKLEKAGRKAFQFNRVYCPKATQDEIFKDTRPLIRSVMDGYNVCILAYGQTGSGKTYTMCGPSGESTKDMGINYFALNDLFKMSNQRKDTTSYEIHAQMVEIYNEHVRDLLSEDSSSAKLEIRSHPINGGMTLPDATLCPVKSTVDVLNLMKLGEVNRAIGSTAMNDQSSRSHSVLTVHVHGKDASGSTLHSHLHLVDLAGSERVDRSEVSGDRLKEAQHINRSLSCLGDVFTALSQKSSHIPYRNSKLTLLLQDALGGNAKTLMFAHISPEGENFAETISTLKFAQRVSAVELGAACLNKQCSEVMELKQQIENLKKGLMEKEAQNLKPNRQPISPHKKSKAMPEITSPRSRRLSIENSWAMKTKKSQNETEPRSPYEKQRAMMEGNPLRSRRMSLEHPSTMNTEKVPHVEPDTMEGISAWEEPKVMLDRTLRSFRRLSIENSRNMKCEEVQSAESDKSEYRLRTPASSQQISFENPSVQWLSIENPSSMKFEKVKNRELGKLKQQKSPNEEKFATTNETPPRSRRLSIKNPSATKFDKLMNTSDRKACKTLSLTANHGIKPNSAGSRRFSLGDPKNGRKDHLEIELSEDMLKISPSESSSVHKFRQLCESQAISNSNADSSNSETLLFSAYEGQPFQNLDKGTPEPQVLGGNAVQIAMLAEVTIAKGYMTTSTVRSAHGKSSQIRKSLRTIGKMINGSDKRNPQKTEAPIKGRNAISDSKSPTTATSRTLRRQSLTGIQPICSENLRRSSLGGKSSNACISETRNAKSPPSRSSTKRMNRQM